MRDVLTIQALAAKKQQEFSPLGMTSENSRPSYDYVKKGDVVRVNVVWFRANEWFVFDLTPIYTALRNALGQTFYVVALSTGTNWTNGGTVTVDVQTRSDYSRLGDVVSIVAGAAQTAGLSVDVASTRGEFISKVESTGGTVPSTIPAPGSVPNQVEKFVDNLTSSPMSLALVLGGAAVLLFVLKR